jgi:integration host factor subunit beta
MIFFVLEGIIMTKADIVERASAVIDIPKRKGEIVVNTVLRCIIEALEDGDRVDLRGFGSFRVSARNSRLGRNPRTGDQLSVPAKKVPLFRAGKEFRRRVNSVNQY